MENTIHVEENTLLKYSFKTEAYTFFLNGKKAWNNGNNEEAIRMFDKALISDPRNMLIMNYKANSYQQLQNLIAAERTLKTIIQTESENHIALYRLGMIYYNRDKNIPLAINFLEKSLDNFPIYDNLLLRFPLATVSYIPKNILLTNLSNFKIQILEQSGKINFNTLKLLENHLLEAINLVPNYAIAFSNLGRVYIMMNDINKALSAFKRGADLGNEYAYRRYLDLQNRRF